MYPSLIANTNAVCLGQHATFPYEVAVRSAGARRTLRVVLRGGFFFDAPRRAQITSAEGITFRVQDLRTGMKLWSPCDRAPGKSDVPFDYEWTDNKGVSHREVGTEHVLPEQAEFLGWLIGRGTFSAENQSIRLAASNVWMLKHVERLAKNAFPGIRVNWYAKQAGYDLTFTAGINNPLKHFLWRMQIEERFPIAVGLFDYPCRIAFLQGLWGAEGSLHVRKGGNDVDLYLTKDINEARTSMIRDLHAAIGMRGSLRRVKCKTQPRLHRLVFSGYANYTVFREQVKQIGNTRMKAPPVKKKTVGAPIQKCVDRFGHSWYKAPIQRIVRNPNPLMCYEVPDARS